MRASTLIFILVVLNLVLVVMRQPPPSRNLGLVGKFVDPTEVPKEPEEKAIELPSLKLLPRRNDRTRLLLRPARRAERLSTIYRSANSHRR